MNLNWQYIYHAVHGNSRHCTCVAICFNDVNLEAKQGERGVGEDVEVNYYRDFVL